MSAIKEQFKLSIELVNGLKKRPVDDELLKLYGLYKQSTEGDCNIPEPSMLYFKERAKWTAWNSNKGKSKDKGMELYTNTVMKLVEKYGLKQ
jgi:diazepam-binding inhibitor (GABA receptor modulating acyl-CoA-binding protein)